MSGLREAFDEIVADVPAYGDLDRAIEQAHRERRRRYGSWPDSPRRQPSSQSSSACSRSPATPTRFHRSRPVPARRPRRPTHPRPGWTPR